MGLGRVFAWPEDGQDRYYGRPNPANDFAACGLEQLADLDDPNACYSFDSLIFRRDIATGEVYAARDSGCSCPTPFENVNGVDDMTRITSVEQAKDWIETQQGRSEYMPNGTWPMRDVDAALEKVAAALR